VRKAPLRNTKYKSSSPQGDNGEEDSLISTKHALRFLYEEALRNDHYTMAIILRDTLNYCEEIIGEEVIHGDTP
jgi:hypothetical protein